MQMLQMMLEYFFKPEQAAIICCAYALVSYSVGYFLADSIIVRVLFFPCLMFGAVNGALTSETDFGGLDWGRGVWTYDNIWYWGSGSGEVDGHRFGFNIGYGFGDTSAASENVIFYDGKAHKIDDVKFNIGENYTESWTFTSSDGRFEMKFEPIIDRSDYTSALGIIVTNQHQVFGRMTGKAVLDDGTVIRIKDFLCFAEKVHNKY